VNMENHISLSQDIEKFGNRIDKILNDSLDIAKLDDKNNKI
jgi:hypothetical protein